MTGGIATCAGSSACGLTVWWRVVQTDRLKPPSGLPHRGPPPARLTGIFRGPGLRPPSGPSSGGSGSGAPRHPLSWTLILGPRKPPKSGRKRPNFSGFLGSCGATPRGGGGAPPTTLILLRNQRTPVRVRRARPSGTSGAPSAASGRSWEAEIREKRKKFFFLSSC